MRIGWIVCAVAACANANPDTSALDVSDASLTVPVGGKVAVSATSQRMDVGGATWSSDSPAIATVDGSGGSATITGVAPGTCMISVQLGVAQRSIAVTVSGGVLDRIDVTGASASVPLGRSLAMTATGHYSDGSSLDITGSVTWDTGDQSIATVDATGSLVGHKVGQTQVTAAQDAIRGHTDITIGAAQVTSISVDPPSHALAKGLTFQLTATGTLTDGTMTDVTAMVTWMTSDATHATITAGLVHAIGVGPATIDARLDDGQGSATIDVGPAVADHLALSVGAAITLAQGQRAAGTAAIVLTDGTRQDVTQTATWMSSDPTVAAVTAGAIDAQATASTATITAMASGLMATVAVTVGATTCHPVINELQTGSAASAADEWVEVYNPCTAAVDVTGWTLVYRAASTVGANDTNSLQAMTGAMAPGELRLYAGPAYGGTFDGTKWGGSSGLLQQNNGGIGLRSGPKDTGPLVDAVTYGTVTAGHPFTEGTSASMLTNDKSVARGPFDGNDTNAGGTDFTLRTTPTPRAANN